MNTFSCNYSLIIISLAHRFRLYHYLYSKACPRVHAIVPTNVELVLYVCVLFLSCSCSARRLRSDPPLPVLPLPMSVSSPYGSFPSWSTSESISHHEQIFREPKRALGYSCHSSASLNEETSIFGSPCGSHVFVFVIIITVDSTNMHSVFVGGTRSIDQRAMDESS